MALTMATPHVNDLGDVLAVLREWSGQETPFQLHAGDLGWFGRAGGEQTARAVRTWSADGTTCAVGLLDGPDLLRLALAPGVQQDLTVARQVADDVVDPDRHVLPAGPGVVESPVGAVVRDVLHDRGWVTDDPWAVLRRDLSDPVEDTHLRIERVGPERAPVWAAVHAAAFGGAAASHQGVLERWHQLVQGPAYADARCVVGYDTADHPVATAIVWSAGPGRRGILEPLGVHPDHRGHGHGRAIGVAAAAALQEMGAAQAMVATPTSNTGAVAAYQAAGYQHLGERRDQRRVG